MAEDLGTAYGGQEDINDKLLLDLAWERQQKKVSGEGFACGHVLCKLLSSKAIGGQGYETRAQCGLLCKRVLVDQWLAEGRCSRPFSG